jgi:hypothetical protein
MLAGAARILLAQATAAVLCVLLPAASAQSADANTGAPAPPRLSITQLNGQTATGQLVDVVPDLVIRAGNDDLTIPWSEVLQVRPLDERPAKHLEAEARLRFFLADGSEFAGEIISAESADLAIRLPDGRTCHPDLAALRAVHVRSAGPAAQARLAEVQREQATMPADAAGDVAVVARGDEVLVLRGRMMAIDSTGALLDWNAREVRLPWERLAGLLCSQTAERRAACLVRLHDGDALAGAISGGTTASLLLRSAIFGQDVALPWPAISRIDCRSDRLVILSDVPPLRYEFEPYFDKTWNYARDTTLAGGPIVLDGQVYTRGLTMHSRAALTYQLDGAFAEFAAVVGIVAEMGTRGCVDLRVIGDGSVLWEAQDVRGGQAPRPVSVDIAGVRELRLEVDYGRDLDLSDHVGWGFARLIRPGP